MEQLAEEFEKLEQRCKASKSTESVEKCIELLMEAKAAIEADPQNAQATVTQLKKQLSVITSRMNEDMKKVYNGLGKYGKAIDKTFKANLDLVNNERAFEGKEHVVNETIAMHFVRQGQFGLANTDVQEANIDIKPDVQARFEEMYRILEALRQKQLEPAIIWASTRRPYLDQHGSNLEFDLHRLAFIQLFTSGQTAQALAYARLHFPGPFSTRHLPAIQKLMCAFAYAGNIRNSPYASLFYAETMWDDIQSLFRRQYCEYLGLGADSPLSTTAHAGALSLPTLVKMTSLLKNPSTTSTTAPWKSAPSLPIEIPLPKTYLFHSVFTCPVSKEQATEENPPMMMPCGHVVCRESLGRLSLGHAVRFKCPYCPSDSVSADARRVWF
ncbi:hypothetical protein YB2330_005154 [Saitoella coloradoensis]